MMVRLFTFIVIAAAAITLSNAQQQPAAALLSDQNQFNDTKDVKLMNENVSDETKIRAELSLTTATTIMNEDNKLVQPKQANLLPERFDFNLDDFEDVVHLNVDTKRQATIDESFEAFTLQPTIHKPAPVGEADDSQNIYRVSSSANKGKKSAKAGPKLPRPSESSFVDTNSTSDHSFQFITQLFDHTEWNVQKISDSVSDGCGQAMRTYLTALTQETQWAVEAMDQSGRYRGLYMFGNEMWVGSQMFCDEINYQRNMKSLEQQRTQPEFQFHAILLKMSVALRKV